MQWAEVKQKVRQPQTESQSPCIVNIYLNKYTHTHKLHKRTALSGVMWGEGAAKASAKLPQVWWKLKWPSPYPCPCPCPSPFPSLSLCVRYICLANLTARRAAGGPSSTQHLSCCVQTHIMELCGTGRTYGYRQRGRIAGKYTRPAT